MTRTLPAPTSLQAPLANGLAFIRLVKQFSRGPLAALESAPQASGGMTARLVDPRAILDDMDATVTGQGPRKYRVEAWSGEMAVAGGAALEEASSRVRSWFVPALVFLGQDAVKIPYGCPVCKARTWAAGGVHRAALWITDSLSVCLACHNVEDLLITARRLEAGGMNMWSRWPAKRDRYPRAQGDLDAAA